MTLFWLVLLTDENKEEAFFSNVPRLIFIICYYGKMQIGQKFQLFFSLFDAVPCFERTKAFFFYFSPHNIFRIINFYTRKTLSGNADWKAQEIKIVTWLSHESRVFFP